MDLSSLRLRLKKWERLGVSRGQHVTYYGERGDGRPSGWMHALYDPVETSQYRSFLHKNKYFSGFDYAAFLSVFNGIDLFRGSLSLFGVHILPIDEKSFVDARFPANIVMENRSFADCAEKFGGIAIGSSTFEDPTRLFIEVRDRRVVSAVEAEHRIDAEWGSFNDFLASEVERLNSAFDLDGQHVI